VIVTVESGADEDEEELEDEELDEEEDVVEPLELVDLRPSSQKISSTLSALTRSWESHSVWTQGPNDTTNGDPHTQATSDKVEHPALVAELVAQMSAQVGKPLS